MNNNSENQTKAKNGAYYDAKYDINHDGVLDGNEISLSMEDAVLGVGSVLDINGDGFISDSEFDGMDDLEELKECEEEKTEKKEPKHHHHHSNGDKDVPFLED